MTEKRTTEAWRADRRRRYLSLGLGELVAAAVFVGAAAMTVAPRFEGEHGAAPLWSALLPLVLILVQGGLYWLLARGWVGRASMPTGLAATYRALRVVNPLLLALGALGIVLWRSESLVGAVLVAAIWAFGLVEYLNYFVVRLAYPAERWFSGVRERRVPQLIQDVRST